MNKEEFINTITYLGVAYNKVFNEQEIAVWYDMLKEYPEEVLNKVVKNLVKTEKFLPAISTIIEKCSEYKTLDRFEVLELMRANNYFKSADEYMKARHWLETGIMPQWFKDEITKTYNLVLEEKGHYISNTTVVKNQNYLLENNNYDNEE